MESETRKIKAIREIVEKYFNLPLFSILIKTREGPIKQARQIAMFLAKENTKASLQKIGKELGNKDHATVLHACKTINNLIDTENKMRADIEELKKQVTYELDKFESDFSLKEIFMLGLGVSLKGKFQKIEERFPFNVCCAVSARRGYPLAEIANYAECSITVITTSINQAIPLTVDWMNQYIDRLMESQKQ